MILRKIDGNDKAIKDVEALYLRAFPESERKPLSHILENEERGVTDILSIEDGKFIGLIITVNRDDLVLIDYFAVDDSLRGGGYGGKAIGLMREMYAGKRIFLEIELPGDEYENNVQRTRRKDFYLRNGLKEGGTRMKIYDTDMELLVFDKPVGFGEYLELFRLGMGDFIKITGEPEEK